MREALHRLAAAGCAATAVVLFTARPAFALDPARRVTQYMQQVLAREDGLPQNSVQSIVQTADGYLWLATQQGLARYNGAGFVTFGDWNTPAIAGNDIQTIHKDPAGALWIGSHGGGLARYRDGRFERVAQQLSNSFVWAVAEDREGVRWVGTDGGLNRIRGNETTVFSTKNGLRHDTVYAVLPASDGALWAGTRVGLTCIRGGVLRTYTTADGLPHDTVRSLYEDRAHNLWVGTLGGGAAVLRNGRFTAVAGLPNPNVFAFLEDRHGNLWIATGGGGLARLQDSELAVLTTRDGLANDTVLSLFEDREGTLWAGTDGGGVTRLQDSKFATVGAIDGLSHDVVSSIAEDAGGEVWVGTLGGGVNRLTGGTIRKYTKRDGLSDEMVFSVFGDREGGVWIGTNDGLNRFQDGRWTVYTTRDGLAANAVSAIYQDRRGAMWFGTPDGVSRFDGGRFTTWRARDGLPADFVLAILEDRAGTMWLGTAAGLARFDGTKFTILTAKDGLAADLIMSLHEDAEGVIWIGTQKGLSRWSGGRITTYTRRHGLFDDLILATISDGPDSLWISSNNGVFRLSRRKLAELAAGRGQRLHPVVFGIADGLRSTECNGGVQPSAMRTRGGVLWFPTVKGASFVDPRRIAVNRVPPPVTIERVVADERDLPPYGPIRLGAGTHRLEVHYAGLSLAAPERVRFRYRLLGFDRGWIDGGGRRTAVYTNLPAGTYSFAVAAANNDGVWSSAPATMAIEQEPHFHQTMAFAVLCALGALAVIAFLFHVYARRLQAEYDGKLAERGRIARELHDTLAQELVGMQLQLNLAREASGADPAAMRGHIDRAFDIGRATLADVRRMLADLRPSALDDVQLGTALRRFAAAAAEGERPRVDVVVQGEPRPLPAGVDSDLLRIGQEAITNAVRHAHASRIEVELAYLRERVRLRVRDDGVGGASAGGQGYGLVGMRERAERMRGRFELRSEASAGTEVVVEVQG
jgi:ligand-binding sensor domain-containing protein/signal transduction histidine kinase